MVNSAITMALQNFPFVKIGAAYAPGATPVIPDVGVAPLTLPDIIPNPYAPEDLDGEQELVTVAMSVTAIITVTNRVAASSASSTVFVATTDTANAPVLGQDAFTFTPVMTFFGDPSKAVAVLAGNLRLPWAKEGSLTFSINRAAGDTATYALLAVYGGFVRVD